MPTNDELDYSKIRDAMDFATEQLIKKGKTDELKSKKEQVESKEKIDIEKKNNIFKWIAYSAAIVIGLIIIIVIIIVIIRMSGSNKSSNNQIQQKPFIPMMPIQQQKPFIPMMPIQQQQPMPMMPIQQQQPMPMMPIQQQQPIPMMPIPMMPIQQPIISSSPSSYQYNNNTNSSSFNFPSNNTSFFNKLDDTSSLSIKKGGRKNK